MILNGFDIGEELGHGPLFRLYRASDRNGRSFIIKKAEQGATYKIAAARLHREFEICTTLCIEGLERPEKVVAYAHDTILLMEDRGYLPLNRVLENGPLELIKALRIAVKLSATLSELHLAGFIHRDIQPGNILLNVETDDVILHGMGISSQIPNSVQGIQGVVLLGIPPTYISPELSGRINRLVDYRTDLYSLGVTLFEMVTGTPPFVADDPLELIHAHVAKRPPLATELNPALPPLVSAIIQKLLAKSAEDRYQGCRGLQLDIHHCLKNISDSGETTPFVLAEHDPPARFELPQRFYGRDTELETLRYSLEDASQGNLRVLMVAGDPGIGKTSLVQELRGPVFEKKGWFAAGKYDALERGTPYSGIREALRDLWRRLLAEEQEQVESYRRRFMDFLGSNAGVIADITPEFQGIVGKTPPVVDLEPLESRNRITLCFQQVLRALTHGNHPLVLFLDDLQWADPSSLELIEGALEKGLGNLFLIGAYRDSEVNERHPLVQTLHKMKERGIAVEYLFLGPLDLRDVRRLVADSLRIEAEKANPLADIVYRKTAGNPFFSRVFLLSLHEEGKLYHDQEGAWSWDLEKIAELETTENVDILAARKIQKIPVRIRHTISMAAALGHPLDIGNLASVCEKMPEEVESDLIEACRERLLIRHEDGYQFRHDRLQESAYNLIPESTRAATHLLIGRLLSRQNGQPATAPRIFAILDHLNRALDLLLDPHEREETARLNLEAGRIAKSAAAFPAAFQYFTTGLVLLPSEPWTTSTYDLALAIYTEAAETAFLTANFREGDRLVAQIISQARSILDKIPAYETQIAIAHARLLDAEAIRITLDVVKLLGVNVPLQPTVTEVKQAVLDTKNSVMAAFSPHRDDVLQPVNPESLAAMRLLARTAVVVGWVNHPLYLVITQQLIDLAIRYPNSPEAPVAYIMAGGVLCYLHDDYENGCRAGDRGMKLLHLSALPRWHSFCHFLFTIDVNSWRKHFEELVVDFNRACRLGLESGDLVTATISSYYSSETALLAGIELNHLQSSIRGFQEDALRIGVKRVSSGLDRLEQVTRLLINGVDSSVIAQGRPLLADDTSQVMEISDDQTVQEITLCHEMMVFSYYRQPQMAYEAALRAHDLPPGGASGLLSSDFYICLSILDIIPGISGTDRDRLLQIVSVRQRRLRLRAQACPMNHRHKLDLVEAQQQRVIGDNLKAMELFDSAIEGARRNRYVHEEALACEIAGEFYLTLERRVIAKAYVQEAISAYAKWGAWGKIDQLNSRYPDLLSPQNELPRTLSSSGRTQETGTEDASATLDISSIEQAGSALSRELDLPKLLIMLIGILLQNAGAQRGFLLREEGGKILIEASGSVDDDGVQVLQRIPIENCNNLSRSIVRFVSRSHETVVLGDASQDERFTGSPYISREKPKSILCAPVMHRGKPVGILYLENNRSRDAFSGDRLKAIQLISAQAAVALENARLMDGLKQEVRIRKHTEDELRRALVEVDRLKERLHAENAYLKEEILGTHGFDEIVGKSEVLRRVLHRVAHVATTDATVLILGETGTGKELIARAIHNRSTRKESSLVRVNCATLPAALIESELFGHEKGAFTGALARKLGRFELADGGTIFLDEIGELPLELQAKLLRVLQEGEFERVGSSTTQKVNVRVIAATNRNLKKEVEDGSFRSDLYYRLSVFPIELPPLRERTEDIPLLVWYFVSKKQGGLGKNISKIPKEIMEALTAYRWPGNIRELENVIERAIILSRGITLSLDESWGTIRPQRSPAPTVNNLDEIERNHIISVLEQCQWRVKGKGNAAEQLGLNPSTLTFRMKKLGIARPQA